MKNIEFKKYKLIINLTPFINIIGTMASGKTTLLRNLINQIEGANIFIDGKSINEYDISFLRKNIAAVLNSFEFITNTVRDELIFYQEKININYQTINKNLNAFIKYFELHNIIDTKIDELSIYDKAYLKILSLLIIKPRVLGIDDMLTYLTIEQKLKILKYAKENKISILNVTTNPEELLFGTHIIILDHFNVIAQDKTEEILSSNQYLPKIGMSEPFIVELSSNLNYYDLLKKKYFDMKSLIGELWK